MSYADSLYQAILAKVGAPSSPNNVDILKLWQAGEGSDAFNNPLDTTRGGYAGEIPYNTFGNDEHVWNYPDENTGAEATAATLEEGYYPAILAALRADNPLASWHGDATIIAEVRTWGTTLFANQLEQTAPAPVPAPAPAPAPAPVPTAAQTYVVVRGDTLSGISLRAYGTADNWPAIWHANPSIANPDLIIPGEVILIPDLAAPLPTFKRYTVVSGDSLWAIAAREYGSGGQWTVIYAANKAEIDAGGGPSDIHPGLELVIPAA